LESKSSVGLRRKAALTRGPAALARHECGARLSARERKGTRPRACDVGPAARLGPRELGRERSKGGPHA
jgi:hypothetical protein